MPLLTVHQMQEILSRFQYDGYNMEVYEGFKEGAHFKAIGVCDDNFNPGEKVRLEIHSPIPPQVSEESFTLWISWRMCRQEIHESCEKLKIKSSGDALYNPHREFADKDEYY